MYCLKSKRVLPLALDVYSIEDPTVGSENLQIERAVEAVNRRLNNAVIGAAATAIERGNNAFKDYYQRVFGKLRIGGWQRF